MLMHTELFSNVSGLGLGLEKNFGPRPRPRPHSFWPWPWPHAQLASLTSLNLGLPHEESSEMHEMRLVCLKLSSFVDNWQTSLQRSITPMRQWRIQGVSRVSRHPPFCLGALFEKNKF